MISASQVIQLIEAHGILLPDEPLEAETNLFSQGLDSVALMQLLLLLESEFQLSLSPAEISRERFSTPTALAAYLSEVPPSAS